MLSYWTTYFLSFRLDLTRVPKKMIFFEKKIGNNSDF